MQRKDTTMSFRLTTKERQLIERSAWELGVSASEFIMQCVKETECGRPQVVSKRCGEG